MAAAPHWPTSFGLLTFHSDFSLAFITLWLEYPLSFHLVTRASTSECYEVSVNRQLWDRVQESSELLGEKLGQKLPIASIQI